MPGRIIGCFSCILCALPFFYLAWEGKQKNAQPLAFWAGDDSIKDKVKDIPAYNQEMARLYNLFGASFAAAALFFLIFPPVGLALIFLNCTLGIYIFWRAYKKILARYESPDKGEFQ